MSKKTVALPLAYAAWGVYGHVATVRDLSDDLREFNAVASILLIAITLTALGLFYLANRSSVPPLRQRRLMMTGTLAAVLSVAGYMLMYLGRDKGAAEANQAFLAMEARLNQLADLNEKQAIEIGELRQLVVDYRQAGQTFGAYQPADWNKATKTAASARISDLVGDVGNVYAFDRETDMTQLYKDFDRVLADVTIEVVPSIVFPLVDGFEDPIVFTFGTTF